MRLSTIFVPFLSLQGIAIALWQILGGSPFLWVFAAWVASAPAILAFAVIRSRRSEPNSEMSVAGHRRQRMRE